MAKRTRLTSVVRTRTTCELTTTRSASELELTRVGASACVPLCPWCPCGRFQAASAFTPFWTAEAADCVVAVRMGGTTATEVAADAAADTGGARATDTAVPPPPAPMQPPAPEPVASDGIDTGAAAVAPRVPVPAPTATASPASASAPTPAPVEIRAGALLSNETVDVVNVLLGLSQKDKAEKLAGSVVLLCRQLRGLAALTVLRPRALPGAFHTCRLL